MAEKELKIEDLWSDGGGHNLDINSIVPAAEANTVGFFYGRHVVFTGKLEKMIRKDAMQLVVNLGGVLDNGKENAFKALVYKTLVTGTFHL